MINKIDRLIQEWRMQPQEAYDRIRAIVAHVNMIVSAFQSERFISDADAVLAYEDARASAGQAPRYTLVPAGVGVWSVLALACIKDWGPDRGSSWSEQRHSRAAEVTCSGGHSASGFSMVYWFHTCIACQCREGGLAESDLEDEEDYFQPSLGNVMFASAHDGWGFRTQQFADVYATKLGCRAEVLQVGLRSRCTCRLARQPGHFISFGQLDLLLDLHAWQHKIRPSLPFITR